MSRTPPEVETPKPGQEPGNTDDTRPAPPTERQRLLRAISGAYAGGPSKRPLSPLVRTLKPFTESEDASVRKLAGQGIQLGALGMLIERQSDFRGEARQLLVEAATLAITHSGEDGVLGMLPDAAKTVGQPGGAFDQAIARMRSILQTGDEIQRCFNRMRRTVRDMVDSQQLPTLEESAFTFQMTPVRGAGGLRMMSDVQLTVVNRSGRKLPARHHRRGRRDEQRKDQRTDRDRKASLDGSQRDR